MKWFFDFTSRWKKQGSSRGGGQRILAELKKTDPEAHEKISRHIQQVKFQLRKTNKALLERLADLEKKRLALLKRIGELEERRDTVVANYNELRKNRNYALWLRHLKKTFDFAQFAYEDITDGPVRLCLAHDTYSLQAAELFRKKYGARVLYDAVEVPNYRDRSLAAQKGYATNIYAADFIMSTEYELIRRADSLISISDGLADVVAEQTGAARPTVVRNCRYTQPFKSSNSIRKDVGCKKDDKVVLFLNTINYGDGFEETMEALKELPDYIRFVFLGGVQRLEGGKDINVELRKIGLFERCTFIEAREPKELIRYISGADIMAIVRRPSNLNNEISLPNRVFEAISASVPLVAPNLRDIGKIVADYDIGEVYEATDPGDMAEKILFSLEKRRQKQLEKSLKKANKLLCWEEEEKQFLAAVQTAMAESGPQQGKTVILACKGLERNDRIFRMSKTLVENGHDVHVACLELPKEELFHAKVQYHKYRDPEPDPSGSDLRFHDNTNQEMKDSEAESHASEAAEART
ncbi:glycosyltransferase family 4 protein [Sneathiella limimaris]|uniref:glycosyltransferase family 4 protein n=1 Tax=Sneathiella limimaris TaxID=1964213 RepID=UPI00146C4607|nr:glycosyltransferase family 4 protein [Sneathiella limimaris]